ncbi:unnamed protein product [Cochlearia groenlandica]
MTKINDLPYDLCFIMNKQGLVVWNPYTGQSKWIKPREEFHRVDMYAFGYDNINRNHKILRFVDGYEFDHTGCDLAHIFHWFEIYDFSSDSWRVLHVDPYWRLEWYQSGVSLKGNTYFPAQEKERDENITEDILLCFDFTTERFGPCLALPFRSCSHFLDYVTLSCVRDEQLAVLYQHDETMEIWITTKVDPNSVSWSKFLKVDITRNQWLSALLCI